MTTVHSGNNDLPHWTDRARYEKARRLRRLEGHPPLLVDATGTHRRLRALMAIGWRARDLAPRIGWASGELDTLFRRPTVTRRTAANVHTVYEALSDTPGPSEQTRQRAARSGYLKPGWWDDDTIDDPTYQPATLPPARPAPGRSGRQRLTVAGDVDNVVVARLVDGQRVPTANTAEKYAAYVHSRSRGVSTTAACLTLRLSSSAATLFDVMWNQCDNAQEATG